MSIYRLPEGVELDLKVYLVGMIEDVETEIVLTVGGFPAFVESLSDEVELSHITKAYDLNDLGRDWRVMTREEIADYKKREKEDA